MKLRFVVVTLLVLAAGCGRSHLFYDTRELRHQPLQSQQKQALVQTVEDRLGGRRVTWVDTDGKEHEVGGKDLGKLGMPELGALWLATSSGELGGENDVRVQLAGKPAAPVSVFTALDGSVRVVSARRAPPPEEPALTEEQIRDRFGLAKPLPGKWAEPERRALTDALAMLAPEELAVLRTVFFDRSAHNNDPSRAALYQMRGCDAVVYLFASGSGSDRYRFVGDASAPKSAVLHSLVHEIGHAFEQSMARKKYCDAGHQKGAAANDAIHEGDALVDNNPILKGYLEALGGEPAPTDYGNSSPHESFAESFALWHVDPDALKRAAPAAYAWFAAGGHIKARS